MKRFCRRLFSESAGRLASVFRVLVLLLFCIVLVGAAGWYFAHRNVEFTDNATVQCDVIDIVSEVKGVIHSIYFEDDQYVALGAPLVRIEDGIYKAQLARADATLSIARSSYQRAQRHEELLSIELPADVLLVVVLFVLVVVLVCVC